MPLFVCENCKCVENTALGHFWSRKFVKYEDSFFNNKALCSECAPLKYIDGSNCGDGKWHNKFPKQNVNELLKELPDCDLINYKNGKFL